MSDSEILAREIDRRAGTEYVWSRLQLFGQVDAKTPHPFSFSVKKIYLQDYTLP